MLISCITEPSARLSRNEFRWWPCRILGNCLTETEGLHIHGNIAWLMWRWRRSWSMSLLGLSWRAWRKRRDTYNMITRNSRC